MKKTDRDLSREQFDAIFRTFVNEYEKGKPLGLIQKELGLTALSLNKLYLYFRLTSAKHLGTEVCNRLTEKARKAREVWLKLNAYQGQNCGQRYYYR